MVDLKDESFLRGDRTAFYSHLRAEAPVLRISVDGEEAWLVARYEDVQAILRTREARVQALGQDAPSWLSEGPALRRLKANLAQTDDPVHQRLRSVLQRLFLPRSVDGLRQISAASVQQAIATLPKRGKSFDVVHELAAQVPKGVICHLVGIPPEDWNLLTARQHDFLLIFSNFPISEAERSRLDDVCEFYADYFGELLDHLGSRESPLLNALREAENDGRLSRVETLSIMHTVLDAGYETTRTAISNAIELLAMHPRLFRQIRGDPGLIPNAVEEFLRFQTPIHVRHRYLTEAYRASDGTTIPEGAYVLVVLASANRDEMVFQDADHVNVGRRNAARHQAFGGGVHYCIGGPLARLQIQETLKAIVSCVSEIHLADSPRTRFASLKFPALQSLAVTMI